MVWKEQNVALHSSVHRVIVQTDIQWFRLKQKNNEVVSSNGNSHARRKQNFSPDHMFPSQAEAPGSEVERWTMNNEQWNEAVDYNDLSNKSRDAL